MAEIIRPRPLEPDSGPDGLGDPFAAGDSGAALVTSGVYSENLPVAGRTVGEIRRRYGDRFDLDPESQAMLNGHPVGNDTVVLSGQMLSFVHRSGEKGSGDESAGDESAGDQNAGRLVIQGDQVAAEAPEGETASVPVERFLALAAPRRQDTGSVVLPDGVKAIVPGGCVSVWVLEIPPRIYNLKWIAADSPARYGSGSTYRDVRIALPYLIVMAAFQNSPGSPPALTNRNECFFRTAPLCSLDDPLQYPALLNCSKFDPQEDRPLSWICSQYMPLSRRRLGRGRDANESCRKDLQALLHCLLETGFNYSSEQHEAASWFTESVGQDERIATIERWQDETNRDPGFVLDVPFLEVGKSVGEVAARIIRINGGNDGHAAGPRSAAELARLVFNADRRQKRKNRILQAVEQGVLL